MVQCKFQDLSNFKNNFFLTDELFSLIICTNDCLYADIQGNLRSLRLALKQSTLYQNAVDLERPQKPFEPYQRVSLKIITTPNQTSEKRKKKFIHFVNSQRPDLYILKEWNQNYSIWDMRHWMGVSFESSKGLRNLIFIPFTKVSTAHPIINHFQIIWCHVKVESISYPYT